MPSPLWGLRGGDDQEEQDSFYTSIGFQVVGKTESLSHSSSWLQRGSNFMLLKDDNLLQPSKPSSSGTNDNKLWDGDEIAVESLAIGCDILVLVVVVDMDNDVAGKDSYLDVEFTQALERGLRHRADSGMKSSLLVLLVSSNTSFHDSKMSSEKDRLLLQDLSRITPTIVSSLDILSLEDPEESNTGLETAWKELIQETAVDANKTTSFLVEAEAFPILLHDIYKAKGGKQTRFSAPLKQPLVTGKGTTEGTESPLEAMKEDINVAGGPSIDQMEPIVTEEKEEGAGEAVVAFDEATLDDDVDESAKKEEETQSDEQRIHSALVKAESQISDLEAKQEQMWLGFSSNDLSETSWHLEFGPEMDRIIDQFQDSMQDEDQSKQLLFTRILPHLKSLYEHHLQFLREQYGKQYEAALEQTAENPEEYQKQWKAVAGEITSSFREAAKSAIPIQCREGGQLRDADFEYVTVLEGLLQDMMQATEDQEEFLGISPDWDEEENSDNTTETGVGPDKKRKRPAKWYHKVAAKAFVFGVNYFQGWLAYQGIKRAAAQRDLHLPKFPLF